MLLRCPECAAPLRATDVLVVERRARCSACSATADISAQLASFDGDARSLATWLREEVARPAGIALRRTPARPPTSHYRTTPGDSLGTIEIVQRWRREFRLGLHLFGLAFVVLWLAVLGAAVQARPMRSVGDFVMLSFLVLAGTTATYVQAAQLLNRATIRVTERALTVRHGPLPWRGNRSIASGSLVRLEIGMKSLRGRHGVITRSFELLAVVDGGHRVVLLAQQPEAHVRFMRQEIERHLALDQVPSETPRDAA